MVVGGVPETGLFALCEFRGFLNHNPGGVVSVLPAVDLNRSVQKLPGIAANDGTLGALPDGRTDAVVAGPAQRQNRRRSQTDGRRTCELSVGGRFTLAACYVSVALRLRHAANDQSSPFFRRDRLAANGTDDGLLRSEEPGDLPP